MRIMLNTIFIAFCGKPIYEYFLNNNQSSPLDLKYGGKVESEADGTLDLKYLNCEHIHVTVIVKNNICGILTFLCYTDKIQ